MLNLIFFTAAKKTTWSDPYDLNTLETEGLAVMPVRSELQ